jgi:hypothetical protein
MPRCLPQGGKTEVPADIVSPPPELLPNDAPLLERFVEFTRLDLAVVIRVGLIEAFLPISRRSLFVILFGPGFQLVPGNRSRMIGIDRVEILPHARPVAGSVAASAVAVAAEDVARSVTTARRPGCAIAALIVADGATTIGARCSGKRECQYQTSKKGE